MVRTKPEDDVAWTAIDPPTITDTIKQPPNQDLYDLLADLTMQAYFVARELAPDNPAEMWRDLAYSIMATIDAKDVHYLNTTHVEQPFDKGL